MKKFTAVLIFFFLLTKICFSQSGWYWQNPLPTGNSLNGVKLCNSTTGIAVGIDGTILRTSDRGVVWSIIQNKMNFSFTSICKINENQLVAVGTKGFIYKTSNNGLNWFSIVSGTESDLNTVFFTDQYTAYAGGNNVIIKSTNAGSNWFILGSSVSRNILCMFFINANTGWFTTSFNYPSGPRSEIYKTENGGVAWYLQYSYYNSLFKSIFFINQDTGWCSPNLKTLNGGQSWQTDSNSFDRIYFINSLNGWKYLSADRVIYKTTDGGSNWISKNCFENNMYDINFFDSLNGFCVGQYGRMIKSTNAGETWIKISSGYYNDIVFLNFIDTLYGWAACEQGTILKTTNSGVNWHSIFVGDSSLIIQVYFVSHAIGYAVNYSGKTFKSTNGGNNWFDVGYSGYIPNSVYFLNKDTGWVGDLNEISKTTNGGLNWSHLYYNDLGYVKSFHFLNSQTGWASGFNIFKTTNGGLSWFSQTNNSEGYYGRIYFTSELSGWTFKWRTWGNNYFYRTTNGGTNWFQTYHGNLQIYDFSVKDSLNAIAVGEGLYDDTLMRTYNGGYNWVPLQSVSREHGWTSLVLKSNKLWLGGDGGAILVTTDFGGNPIGINPINSVIPTSFSLSQNYPNPFNPVTKIRYDIPPSKGARGMMTKLIIYDILGKEIETLVKETQRPGSYEVTWDGSRHASGVYFYRLITDDFVETKKMVLIK